MLINASVITINYVDSFDYMKIEHNELSRILF